MAHVSSNSIPLGLDRLDPDPVWKIGVDYRMKPDVEAVAFFDTKEAAQIFRVAAISLGGKILEPGVAPITTNEASDLARELGASEVQVIDMNLRLIERWLV